MTPVDPMATEGKPTEGYIRFQDGFKYQLVQDSLYRLPCDLFTNDPDCKKAPEEKIEKIVLTRDIVTKFVTLTTDGRVLSMAGFAWNGVSGPTVQRNTNRRGGQVHDALCRLIRYRELPLSARDAADEILRRIWIEDKMWEWLANAEVKLMRIATDAYVQPSEEPRVMTSP